MDAKTSAIWLVAPPKSYEEATLPLTVVGGFHSAEKAVIKIGSGHGSRSPTSLYPHRGLAGFAPAPVVTSAKTARVQSQKTSSVSRQLGTLSATRRALPNRPTKWWPEYRGPLSSPLTASIIDGGSSLNVPRICEIAALDSFAGLT